MSQLRRYMHQEYKILLRFGALVITITLIITGCTNNNLLVGKWKPDAERTLKELKLLENPSKAALNCYEKEICGTGLVEYFDEIYITIIVNKNGAILSKNQLYIKF